MKEMNEENYEQMCKSDLLAAFILICVNPLKLFTQMQNTDPQNLEETMRNPWKKENNKISIEYIGYIF